MAKLNIEKALEAAKNCPDAKKVIELCFPEMIQAAPVNCKNQ